MERMTMETQKLVETILSDVSLLTCDRIHALSGGHGSLTIAYLSVANCIVAAHLSGEETSLVNANAAETGLD
jgi:hypothetical protein